MLVLLLMYIFHNQVLIIDIGGIDRRLGSGGVTF